MFMTQRHEFASSTAAMESTSMVEVYQIVSTPQSMNALTFAAVCRQMDGSRKPGMSRRANQDKVQSAFRL
jgi:hypothetical protein